MEHVVRAPIYLGGFHFYNSLSDYALKGFSYLGGFIISLMALLYI